MGSHPGVRTDPGHSCGLRVDLGLGLGSLSPCPAQGPADGGGETAWAHGRLPRAQVEIIRPQTGICHRGIYFMSLWYRPWGLGGGWGRRPGRGSNK